MKTLVVLTLVFGLGVLPAHAGTEAPQPELLGRWKYDGFFYENNRFPNPNPAFYLTFTFRENGTSRLYWHRTDETGFCEREAIYEIREDDHLYQKVTWLNPKNQSNCGQDPDMRMGRETESRYQIRNDELHLFFDLNGKEFIYILRRCDSNGTECPDPS